MRKPGRVDGRIKPTIEDVARQADVSTATVSRALRFPGQVSSPLVSRVASAVAALGYSPSASARALATLRSGTVAVVVGELSGHAGVVSAAVARLAAFGLAARLVPGEASRETITDSELEGAILVGTTGNALSTLRAQGVPCVAFGTEVEAGVRLDLTTAAGRLARHLAEMQVNDVVLLDCETPDPIRHAWRDAVLGWMPAAHVIHDAHSAVRLMEEIARPAIICTSDFDAASVLAIAHHRGVQVPADIACVGFGDERFAAHLVPALTTLRLDQAAIGNSLVTSVLSLRAGGRATVQAQVPKLVIRRSTGFT